jgi:N6-L-threonylcarbamoyladenine synthase
LDNDKPMLVLGIETTCDETAAAVVERQGDGSGRILSNIVRSQTTEHARFGGVVPEIAARAHVDLLDGIVGQAMKDANVGFAQLSAVAAAAGPGLIGGVIVGLTTAKAIAMVHDTPLIAVNHLEAHALTPRLTCALAFPYCLFLASGGHTQIVAVVGVGQYVRLGTTVDDAMGGSLRQGRQNAVAALSRRTGGRTSSGERRRQAVRLSAADARAAGCEFLAVGIEDGGAQ